MFSFFKKKKDSTQPIESVQQINEPKKNITIFDNIKDELFDNPSFNLLIQCDHKTGNFIIAFEASDLSDENLESAVILLTQLTNGGCKDTLYEAILSSATTDKELDFCNQLISQCGQMDTYVNEAKIKAVIEEIDKADKDNKEKIDPTKIFNIKGSQYER